MSLRGRPSRSIALAATISAWVESRPPLTPMTTFGCPIAREPLLEPGDLDVVGLVAVEREAGGVVGDERDSGRPCAAARCRRSVAASSNSTSRKSNVADPEPAAVVVVAPLPDPLLAQPVEVDVDDGRPRTVGEPLALAEQVAALVDHGLAVPGQVGGRLALAGRGVEVGRVAARAGRPDQLAAALGPADGDRAGAEVGQHGRAGERRLRARRHRHPHVLADLDVQVEPGDVGGA